MGNPAGFPRPTLPREGHATPLPWIGSDGPVNGEWKHIDGHRAADATIKKLCIICGLGLDDSFVYAVLHGKTYDDCGTGIEYIFSPHPGAPTFGHPKCILLASLFCPYLKKLTHPARTQRGENLTLDALKALTRSTKSSAMSELPS